MVATMAGGAADCQFWTRYVAKYCKYDFFIISKLHCYSLYELREKTEITVSAAAKYFSNVMYSYRGMGLCVVSLFYI